MEVVRGEEEETMAKGTELRLDKEREEAKEGREERQCKELRQGDGKGGQEEEGQGEQRQPQGKVEQQQQPDQPEEADGQSQDHFLQHYQQLLQQTSAGPITHEALAGITGIPMTADILSVLQPHVGASGIAQPDGEHHHGVVEHTIHDVLAGLSQEELQAILTGQLLVAPVQEGHVHENRPYKNWWDEKDELELMQIMMDKKYRKEKLGTEELNWTKMEMHFERSKNAMRKKYWLLKAKMKQQRQNENKHVEQKNVEEEISGGPDEEDTCKRQRMTRKVWTDEENTEMKRLVQDVTYRQQIGIQTGNHDISWQKLANKFGCPVQTAKRKFKSLLAVSEVHNGVIPEKKKREHHKKSTSYRIMVRKALERLNGNIGTAPEIFEIIETDPDFSSQLDTRLTPGTKNVPRWKIQVRKALCACSMFINTGLKQKHETVWKLSPEVFEDSSGPVQDVSYASQVPSLPVHQEQLLSYIPLQQRSSDGPTANNNST